MHRLSRTAGHLGVAPASGARREHAPGRVPAPRASQEWQDRIYALHELIPMAKSQLTKQDWEFMRGGSDAEASIRRNRIEIDSLALRPSMLEDVSSIDLSTTLFGGELAMPIISAPMGGMGRWDPADGARACARACATAGAMTCLSSLADGLDPGPTCRLEEVAAATDAPKIFQLYIRGDDDYVDDYTQRAIDAGYNAFAITVDVQLISRREGMITSRFQRGPGSASGGQDGLDHQSRFNWASLEVRLPPPHPRIPLRALLV